jgi:5-formyltetrahydrofolate cyclo-ligase
MDYVATPERTIATDSGFERPDGVDWDALSEEKIAEIPVLQERRP